MSKQKQRCIPLVLVAIIGLALVISMPVFPAFAKSHKSGSSGSSHRGLAQLPSNATDFPDNDPSVILVHVTTAKKDITGAYHVMGEITNKGNDTLNSVQVTVHFYDASGNLIADSTCCFTTPLNIDPGHTSTFDSFVTSDQISGKPASYRLSYDWS
jgi:hypothetical protein